MAETEEEEEKYCVWDYSLVWSVWVSPHGTHWKENIDYITYCPECGRLMKEEY